MESLRYVDDQFFQVTFEELEKVDLVKQQYLMDMLGNIGEVQNSSEKILSGPNLTKVLRSKTLQCEMQ